MAMPKQTTSNILPKLIESLPPSATAVVGDDLDLRARAVLAFLVERLPNVGEQARFMPTDAKHCPNCDQPALSKTSPYCSDCCRQHAAFVRQMRDGLAQETILDPQRQTMKGEVLWRLLGAGLPRRLSLVPEKARERVLKKVEGK